MPRPLSQDGVVFLGDNEAINPVELAALESIHARTGLKRGGTESPLELLSHPNWTSNYLP